VQRTATFDGMAFKKIISCSNVPYHFITSLTLLPKLILPYILSLASYNYRNKELAHLHLVPTLIMRGAVPPLPHTSSWHDT